MFGLCSGMFMLMECSKRLLGVMLTPMPFDVNGDGIIPTI